MQFNPRALLISAVFIALLWFAVTRSFGLVAIAFETLFGWGLWQWFSGGFVDSIKGSNGNAVSHSLT